MRISRICIKNFRNFKSLDLDLGEHAVILGENRVGKTNLLFALRLILDPSLPDSMRKLRLDDFWDGLPRPLTRLDRIDVLVEFSDFEDNENLLAVLADHLVQPSPMVARVTYRFQPIPGLDREPKSESDYEFITFGGEREDSSVGFELRRWMPMDLFPALRDAEADLARWSRSPLRPLLDRAARDLDEDKLAEIAKSVHETTSEIAKLVELSAVVNEVNFQLSVMVGNKHAVETALGFAPTEADRLLRALQLMIDGGRRGVADASLGSANVLYLALKHLEHHHLVKEGERQHTFLAIEEPEAHLHPHVQRLIYRSYLRARGEGDDILHSRSIMLTTHSPNVASVAPLSNMIVLRQVHGEHHTAGYSLSALEMSDSERADLERYIDVTRGEIFFAKGVILVEGEAERFLLPALARLYDPEIDFDSLGITVCSVGGTNFGPYLRLLGPKGLNIPFVVLTDFDPKSQSVSQEDGDPDETTESYGRNRVVNQIMPELMDTLTWERLEYDDILERAPSYGVFLNDFTFEIDLFKAGAVDAYVEAVGSLSSNVKMHGRFEWLSIDPESIEPTEFLKDIESIGKGRVAQRLATVLMEKKESICPPYVRDALTFLKARLK